jgi:hypothetical protein
MIARAISLVSVLCISTLLFAGTTARDITQQSDRRGKPDRPGKPGDAQWMEFYGDLEGSQRVEGCCPNAGPFPEYTMTINSQALLEALGLWDGDFETPYTYHGGLFFNRWGVGRNAAYIVQFWTEESDPPFGILIRGGVNESGKGDPVIVINFEGPEVDGMKVGVECYDLSTRGEDPETYLANVKFVLAKWQCN